MHGLPPSAHPLKGRGARLSLAGCLFRRRSGWVFQKLRPWLWGLVWGLTRHSAGHLCGVQRGRILPLNPGPTSAACIRAAGGGRPPPRTRLAWTHRTPSPTLGFTSHTDWPGGGWATGLPRPRVKSQGPTLSGGGKAQLDRSTEGVVHGGGAWSAWPHRLRSGVLPRPQPRTLASAPWTGW